MGRICPTEISDILWDIQTKLDTRAIFLNAFPEYVLGGFD